MVWSAAVVYQIRWAQKTNNSILLTKLLTPVLYNAGSPSILSKQKQKMRVRRIEHASERKFALEKNHIKQYMGKVTNDGTKTEKNKMSCDDILRSFGTISREITVQMTKYHSPKYYLGENIDHVSTMVNHLKQLKKKHPNIFQDPNCIRKLDETVVKATYGEPGAVFNIARTDLEGRCYNIKCNGAYLTAVIATSAVRLIAPPFSVAACKNVMPRWKKALDLTDRESLLRIFNGWLTRTRYWTVRACIPVQKGSMKLALMLDPVKQSNELVLKTIPRGGLSCCSLMVKIEEKRRTDKVLPRKHYYRGEAAVRHISISMDL